MNDYQALTEEQKREALTLTRLELNTWKLHDQKMPNMLMHAQAELYAKIYPISKDRAFEISEPWISAVWWHDIAETAEDAGQDSLAEMYWEKVQNSLRNHYRLLSAEIGPNIDGDKIALHDFGRWVAHHRREYEKYIHHEAVMIKSFSSITHQDAYSLGQLRADAVWLHNDTHFETGVSEKDADKIWETTFSSLSKFYMKYLGLRNSESRWNFSFF